VYYSGVISVGLSGLGNCRQSVGAAEPPTPRGNRGHPGTLRTGDSHAHGLTDANLEALRAILRNGVNDQTVPAVSLLLAHKGEVIFKEGFENLSVDQKALIASSAKPITATVVVILADQK
jgi:CubicO group peptidase (beta-lactamase class C family)